jgi:hypothetical protein
VKTGTRNPRTTEDRLGDERSLKLGFGQESICEVHFDKVRKLKVGALKPRLSHGCPVEVCTMEVGAFRAGAIYVRRFEVRGWEVRAVQIRPSQRDTSQPCIGEVGAGKIRSSQIQRARAILKQAELF